MESQLKDKLYRASARTFEELAFLLPSEKMGEEQAALPMDRAVLVRFSGPFCGRLVLKVSSSLPPALAANMLGEEGPAPETAQSDALKETANVICGNFLPDIAGPQEVFRLEAPELMGMTAGAFCLLPSARAELGIEYGRCEVEFYAEGPGATKV